MRGELRGPRLPAIFRASVRRGWSSHPPLPLMSHHARLLQRELASLVARRNFCSFPAVPRLSASALYCLARVLRPAPALLLSTGLPICVSGLVRTSGFGGHIWLDF